MLLLRRLGGGAAILLLAACSSHTDSPSVYASGYIADEGVVRLWRKDDPQQNSTRLIVVYNPIQGDGAMVTRYLYQQGTIREIKRTLDAGQDDTQIRFAQDGTVSFMQRQLSQRRESISDEALTHYQWDAKQLLELSQVLQVGKVSLKQGTWQNGQIKTCAGDAVRPDLDGPSYEWIAQRRQQLTGPLSIAWLEAPEGTQLLLVDQGDFCRWETEAGKL